MALTSIGDARTPSRPVEVTFGDESGTPSANQEVLLIGHKDATSGTVDAYVAVTIDNSGDEAAGTAEAAGYFGAGSEIVNMVTAAIKANAGASTFPRLKCVALASADVGFGSADVALTNAQNVKAEFVVSPYDANSSTLRDKLKTHCLLVSGATRVENNQFGTMGVTVNRSVTSTSSLPTPDTVSLIPIWFRDTGTGDDEAEYTIGEVAAAAAAVMAANAVPFNPLDAITIQNLAAPLQESDWISVGDALESEAALLKGWTPLRVKANGEVAFVRTITARVSADGTGTPVVTAYYDVQDIQTLFYWRKTVYTLLSQPSFKKKASAGVAQRMLGEVLRLATEFEDQGMFQGVARLAKLFQVQRVTSDRHSFEVFTPVNVVPGLHRVKTNVQATTLFDELLI